VKKIGLLIFIVIVSGCASFESSYKDSLWKVQSFDFQKDELSCDGKQLLQYNHKYNVFVGLTLCHDADQFRVYMSKSVKGPFLPVTDTAGHGQDHCELVNKDFKLPNSDNIKSGGCTVCNTSRNLPLEYVDTWARADIGHEFKLVRSGEWSYQTSRLQCGVVFENCASLMRGSFTTVCDAVLKGDK
jgi:hypothetical protein